MKVNFKISRNSLEMSRKIISCCLALLLIMTVILPITPSQAAPVTVNVTKLTDDTDTSNCGTGGACSLRAAILYANANGGGTIILPAGTYVLTEAGPNENNALTGDLDIKSNITIIGSNGNPTGNRAATVIKAGTGFVDRIFDINPLLNDSGYAVTLQALTISNGDIQDYTVNGQIVNQYTEFGGGGVRADTGNNTVSFENVAIENNKTSAASVTRNGGGLYLSGLENGLIKIQNSLIANNSAEGSGGGVFHEGLSKLQISNSTFNTNNVKALGGGLYTLAPLTMDNGTFTSNGSGDSGGGLYIDNNTNVASTISNSAIQSNTATKHGGGIYARGALTITNSMLSSNDATGNGGGLAFNDTNDTLTISNSDIQSNTAKIGGGIYTLSPIVMTSGDVTNNSASGNGGGLALYNQTVASTISGSTIQANTGVVGGGLYTESPITMTSSTVTKNIASGNGGGLALYNKTIASTISESSIQENTGGAGGGLYTESPITLSLSTVTKNIASGNGGGLALYNQTVASTISKSTIQENKAVLGGGLYTSSLAKIEETSVYKNTASSDGGGVYITTSNLATSTILKSTVYENTATRYGGGLHIVTPVEIENSTVSGNTSSNDGGGVYFNTINSKLKNTTIANNKALNDKGSGIFSTNASSNIELRNTIVATNRTQDVAGGFSTTSDYNLIGTTAFTFTRSKNILNVTSPGLLPLGDYGGTTLTHALDIGSPALDAGDNTIVLASTTDQRNKQRKVDAADADTAAQIDIGSFEALLSIEKLPNLQVRIDKEKVIKFNIGNSISPVELTANSSNQNLVKNGNIVITGVGSEKTVTITPESGKTGDVTINIIAASNADEKIPSITSSFNIEYLHYADLIIHKTHSGDFTQGQQGATYALKVENIGMGPTLGEVVVIDELPAPLVATDMSGIGWDCNKETLTCKRTDMLTAGESYPEIFVKVNVPSDAPAQVTNIAKVSGGEENVITNNDKEDNTNILTPQQAVEKAKTALEIGFSSGDSATNVTKNVTLAANAENGTTVIWSSSNTGAIKTTGEVQRPSYSQGDQTVTLQATINLGSVQDTKTFAVIVKALPATDSEAVQFTKNALNIGYATGDFATGIQKDIILATEGIEGAQIQWASDNSAIAIDGKVTRPSYTTGDQEVTLTATITRGSVVDTKIFTVTVKALPQTDNEAVASAKAALTIDYAADDSATSVTQNITLPIVGTDDTTISWSSNATTVIAADGKVTRQSYTIGDKTVTLTATITKGDATETKIFTLIVKALPQTDEEAVASAKAALTIGYATGDNETAVVQNITLSTAGTDSTAISWSSDMPSVITASGNVTRPSFTTGDQEVTLTATIAKGDVTDTKTFTVIVTALPQTDAEAIANAKTALAIGYATGDSATNVTEDITLPTTGLDGTAISWTSTTPIVIAVDGKVTRPSYVAGDQTVTLTATITKGNDTATKEFDVVVKSIPPTDEEAVVSAKTKLTIGYVTGDSATNVTEDIILPTLGIDATVISWSSSLPTIINVAGTVTRPSYTVGDKTVELTATITKGSASETKQFEVIVKALPQTNEEAVASAKTALAIGYASGDSETSLTQNVTLPLAGIDGTTVSWSTDTSSVITTAGTVTRPSYTVGDKTVELTATITKGSASETKVFEVVVKALPQTDTEAVINAKTALTIGYANGDSEANVTQNVTLPLMGIDGATVSWSSDTLNVLSTDGKVTRPNYTEGDKTVKLTATISKGSASETKIFTLIVKALTPPPTSTTPTEEELSTNLEGDNNVSIVKVTIKRTTAPDGKITDNVLLDATIASTIVSAAKEQGIDVVRLILPNTGDKLSEVLLEIPQSAVNLLNDGKIKVEIVTQDGIISIPELSLQKFDGDLYFKIEPMKSSNQLKDTQERINKSKIITDISNKSPLQIIGRPVVINTNLQNRIVSLRLPLGENSERKDVALKDLAIFIEHSDGTTELIQGKIVKMQDGTDGIEFTTTKFSTFTIVYIEGINEYFQNQTPIIHKAYIKGIEGKFLPNSFVTRVQIAAMIARNFSNEQNLTEIASYQDVPADHWAYQDVLKVRSKGIMIGNENNAFSPNNYITRVQMAAIAYRWIHQECKQDPNAYAYCGELLNTKKADYQDVPSNHWAIEEISFMKQIGVMNGFENQTFRPNDQLTRAQAVKVINRILKRGPLTQIDAPTFKDVDRNHWAFGDIEEAARDHEFVLDTNGHEVINQ